MRAKGIRRSDRDVQERIGYDFQPQKVKGVGEGQRAGPPSALPIKHAFSQRVNVSEHENGNETEHAPENDGVPMDHVAINHRPRVHEYDFEIEQNEEHRDQVKLYTESRLRFADRDHPAFISRIFDRIAAAGLTQKHADDQSRAGETDRDNDL